jgi:hypothetical protein
MNEPEKLDLRSFDIANAVQIFKTKGVTSFRTV